jgi:hypothetical protein
MIFHVRIVSVAKEIAAFVIVSALARIIAGKFHGKIRVLSVEPDKFETGPYLKVIADIDRASSVWGNRLQRCLRKVVVKGNWRLNAVGQYIRIGKICLINADSVIRDGAICEDRIARILIHECTHGLLILNGIPYTKENRDRVERACLRAERRAIRRMRTSPRAR